MHGVLLYSRNMQEHLRRALQVIREKHLLVSTPLKQTNGFLGFHVSASGIGPGPRKLDAFLALYTRTHVQNIIGLAPYYHSFIAGLVLIASCPGDLPVKD